MAMNVLLYIASVTALLVLMSSGIAAIGWLIIKMLKAIGRTIRVLSDMSEG
jgi:hypothetical protein